MVGNFLVYVYFEFYIEGMSMNSYLTLAKTVLEFGEWRDDRTGTGTYSLFSPSELRFDLSKGFPIVTTKRIAWKSVVWELLWFLRGETNAKWLSSRGVRIWNEWANENGDLGPVYGKQWRSWQGADGKTFDQIAMICDEIVKNPTSRRLVVSAWNVAEISEMALPPCHILFQFYVSNLSLHLKVYQRSVDIFLGLPFNIASYALLLEIIAKITGKVPGNLHFTFGDAHIYRNHVDQIRLQLQREPFPLPRASLPNIVTLSQLQTLTANDFALNGYTHHQEIRAPISV